MPAQPACFHRLDEILSALRSMTSTHLDRAAVEKLFRVHRAPGADGGRHMNVYWFAARMPNWKSLQVLLDVGEIDDILDLLGIGFHGGVARCNN